MTGRTQRAVVTELVTALGIGLVLGQTVAASAQTPAAPVVHADNASALTPAAKAALARTVVLHLEQVSLGDALDALADSAHLTVSYSRAEVPVNKTVSLVTDQITVREALRVLLAGTGLEVNVSPMGRVRIWPKGDVPRTGAAPWQQGGGTIGGRVTDAVTRSPLDQVAVRIEGPGLGTISGADGRYTIHDLAFGTYHVTAKRVGYTPLTKTVTTGDSTATADFALAAAPTKLNEVVTTAVGQQRRYEVGNNISTINADSVAPTAPITSLTDLISARAPGVEVLETSGLTGSGEAIRIRGLSSLVLQNDPILIVDGVRQDNSPGGNLGAYFTNAYGPVGGTHPTPTRLNDVDFADIASIDLLKGPSASTEYGTDAANGVIVITTKHGSAGKPQWIVSAERTESGVPARFSSGYYSWGHTTDGTHTAVNCPLIFGLGLSYGYASSVGNCVVDSVTKWNPLNHDATTIFRTGNRGKYDLSVAGGSDAVRYFVSGGLSNETGVIQMPPVFRQLADTAGLRLPSTAFNPNNEQQRSARVNTAIALGPAADLTATGSYLSTYQQTPEAQGLFTAIDGAPALSDAAHYFGYGYIYGTFYTPLAQLTEFGSQNTNRVTGGLTASWRPIGWFVGHATAGVDHGSQRNQQLNYPLASAAYENYPPFLGLADGTTDVYSIDVRSTATASVATGIRAVTSAGVQMVDTRTAGQTASATGVTSTNLTLNGATSPTVTQRADRQATLGGYGEEELSVAGRLFLTGALRVDAGSGFGRSYSTAVYPKASLSWLAVSNGPTTVRVRGAFGESGVQPMNGAAMQLFAPAAGYLGGGTVTTYPVVWPGNPSLRPERSAELEGGVDLGAWANRVSVELTAYSKATYDALVNLNLGATLASYAYQENIGDVRNTGAEGGLTVAIVQSRLATWDVAVNASVNHNTLLRLAPGVANQTVTAGSATYRQAPGYPLYGIWAPRVTYADANHDGIIELGEVAVADSATYQGASLPTREASISTHLGLWQGAVTVGGLVDYRGGYSIANQWRYTADYIGSTRQVNDQRAPQWLQAAALVTANIPPYFNALDVEDGSFLRVREVSVSYALPRRLVRALRMRSVSLTGAVRNLALWTRYTGPDPEASTPGYNVQAVPTSGGYRVNNDVRYDAGTVPLLRYWVTRLNVGI